MRKQYWTIIQPDGELYLRKWWESKASAWIFLKSTEMPVGVSTKQLKDKGYRVVKIWVEIEGE